MTNFQDIAKNYVNQNKKDIALNFYKLDLYNNNFNKYVTYFNISQIYFENKNYDKSLHYIKNSIRNNPNWYKSFYLLGDILFAMKKYEEALRAYTHCNSFNVDIKSIEDKIIICKNKISTFEDTDESDDNIEEEENNNFNLSKFKKSFYNTNVQKLLENDKLKNKILENGYNPAIIFKDKEIFNLMNEIYGEYKKK